MRLAVRAFPFAFVALGTCACTTNHDELAASGTGGASGSTGGATSGGADSGSMPDATASGGAPTIRMEPAGPRKLTVVHGVVDAPSVSLCFAAVRDGGVVPRNGAPVPSGGLVYGAKYVVDALPGIDFARDGVLPYVVAAAPETIAGLDCAALIALAGVVPTAPASDASIEAGLPDASAGRDASVDSAPASSHASAIRDANDIDVPPTDATPRDATPLDAAPPPIAAIRVSALPVIPAGTLSDSLSYLLVLSGCVGGPGVVDASEQSICGSTYAPDQPTLSPILVSLTRITTAARVSLGALNASLAVPEANFVVSPASGNPLTIAGNVVPGALRPAPPNASRGASSLDLSASGTHVQIVASGGSTPSYDEPVSSTLAAGGVGALTDDDDYTLILVGPFPGFAQRKWWNAPLVTVVENAP